jgi:hypothetical protein
MSLLGATVLTAIATAVLALFAFVTAILAGLAFLKQSREVRAVEDQVADGQKVTRQQAKLLQVQTDQLKVQQDQFEAQRKFNAAQAVVLDLQASELRVSVEQRKREAGERRRVQAAMIFLNRGPAPTPIEFGKVGAEERPPMDQVAVVNSSSQPVYDAELHWPARSPQDSPGSHPFGTIMPGAAPKTYLVPKNAEAFLWFRDAAGVKWVLKTDGRLSEQW